MNLAEIHSLVGSLTNDPNHDRYSIADINTELDNTQDAWNVEAKILSQSSWGTLGIQNDLRDAKIDLNLTTNTPISIERVTWNGIKLKKVSKAWVDLNTGGVDWISGDPATLTRGTPEVFFVDPSISVQQIYMFPVPNVSKVYGVEWVSRHDTISALDAYPFTLGGIVNWFMVPYHWGVCYSIAAKLLLRDPSEQNSLKSANYANIARNVLTEVVQVFKALAAEEPKRLGGGRYFNNMGNAYLFK